MARSLPLIPSDFKNRPEFQSGRREENEGVTMVRSILIAEDEELSRNTLAEAFERSGYRVETAPDGITALERACRPHVHLGIFDYQMPGLDGLEVLRRVMERREDLPVLIMTSAAENRIRRRALELGARAFFPKPIDLRRLRKTVVSLIGEELSLALYDDGFSSISIRTGSSEITIQSRSLPDPFPGGSKEE
ncbi:MAG: response regulator [Candidatus Hydrogenedentota bacterium]|nr:MAG: response regulator [Candidatus Hydrogenedentota bacterium]